MNGFRINNINNMNNLDDLIMNQGYMSERTKSPRRLNPNMGQNQFFDASDPYQNVHRLNSNRDMSPNKIVAKTKPLLGNNMSNNGRMPPIVNNNFTNNNQAQFFQNQNKYGYDMKVPQQNNPWKNAKSPRSPEIQNKMFGHHNVNNIKTCYNHPGKKAEYMTETDGEFIFCCYSCAGKLASNNFTVSKIQEMGNHSYNNPQKTKLTYKRREIPCIPQYIGNPVYESIIEFLKEIYTVEQYHFESYEQLEGIDQHYGHQIEMVNEFYRQLEEILSKMHQDHIADIEQQYRKHAQMKDIYLNEIYENLSTIDDIVNDLDESFVTVVTKITQEDIQHFNLALDQNRAKARFFNNQVEQQKDMFSEVISYKEERLMEMIGEFEKCLITLWDESEEAKPEKFGFQKNVPPQNKQPVHQPIKHPQNINRQANNIQFNVPSLPSNVLQPNNRENHKNECQQKFNVLQMHQNCQKPNLARDFQGKGACRQIFDDDEDDENLQDKVSPNFKKI